MSKNVKIIILVIGVILAVYGIYTLIAPEASMSVGGMSVEAQDNTNSYITIVLGIVAIAVSQFTGKK
ncbi:hypothetical protein [Winogradskyella sp.]|uniref:hypothetical protein n=1 Tax=Winogradskyella sp. TaxID=1883156 RepID=UPI0035C81D3D